MPITVTFSADDSAELRTHMIAFLGIATAAEAPEPTATTRTRGRPRKDSEQPAAPASPAAQQAPAAPAVDSPVTPEAPAVAAPSAPVDVPQVDKMTLQNILIKLAQSDPANGRSRITSMCQKYGASTVTGMKEEDFGRLYLDAQAELDKLAAAKSG